MSGKKNAWAAAIAALVVLGGTVTLVSLNSSTRFEDAVASCPGVLVDVLMDEGKTMKLSQSHFSTWSAVNSSDVDCIFRELHTPADVLSEADGSAPNKPYRATWDGLEMSWRDLTDPAAKAFGFNYVLTDSR